MYRIRVALFDERPQAVAAQRCLKGAGILSEIHAEPWPARFWFVSTRAAGIRLEVRPTEAPRADGLLHRWDSPGDWRHAAVRCPECNSFHVDYPQFTNKSLLTNLAMGLMAELGLIERQYYCERCHCMWAKPGAGPAKVRRHMAPDYFLEPSRRLRCVGLLLGALFLLFGSQVHTQASEPQPSTTEPTKFAATSSRTDSRQPNLSTETQTKTDDQAPTYLRDVLPILMGKCSRCHNDQTRMLPNWLDYRVAAARRWELKRRVWDSWRGHYFKQPMPTANSPEGGAITEEERRVLREWVLDGAPRGKAPTYTGALSRTEKVESGKRLFGTICAACHQPTGQGIPGRFPPLAGSDFLNSDKHRAIKAVVNGLQGEVIVNGQTFNNSMPQFPLTDQDIACALTYVYNSFGNSGKEVSPDEVNAVRQEPPGLAGQTTTAKVREEKSPYE